MNVSCILVAAGAAATLAFGTARAAGEGVEVVISASQVRVVAGAPLQLELTMLNEASQARIVEVPNPVHLRFETQGAVGTLDFVPERSGEIEVAPHGYERLALRGHVPDDARGVATLSPTGLVANALALDVQAAGPVHAQRGDAAAAESAQARTTALVDKPPPLAVSVYEPIYFLVGGDGGLNAKFQISLRYRLFDDRGRLARRLPWIDDLYLSFSQTSLWDLGDFSKPFRDSSYRPRLFFSNYELGKLLDGRLRLGVEAGVGHESNGKDGEDSRSFNMLYARPTLTLGDPQGLRLYVAPLIHNYVADGENPDLKDYRGYVDWLLGVGSKGGLDFWATVRKGKRSDFGSLELSASYPLSKLSGGDLTGWLMLQYFGGYGESLLDYSRKLDAQLRLGIAIAL